MAQEENPETVKEGDTPREAYPGMTAIDFADHRYYTTYKDYESYQNYGLGLTAASGSVPQLFYPPLLDDNGLTSIKNCDETQNLLVYAPAPAPENEGDYANAQTHGVLTGYFADPAYDSHYDNSNGYRLVSEYRDNNIHGHLVQSNLTATNDHLLVDKQDFNAPIGYTFYSYTDGDGHLQGNRMWYQRKPEGHEYVDLTMGWQSISIPFTAELVTTDVKGEITHFYEGSNFADQTTQKKIGHEYWLREFTGINKEDVTTAFAEFDYPKSVGTDATKTVTNTFLWDYYYKAAAGHNQLDKNEDTYQTYYNNPREYANYRQLQGGIPYIIGFPGVSYYEFDLSGGFEAYPTTATYKDYLPAKLPKQTITFASNPGITIAVSDVEMNGVLFDGYRFYPNYLNIEMPVGGYVMSDDGDAYNQMTAADVAAKKNKVSAFRTYFSTSATPQTRAARRIVFNGSSSQFGGDDQESQDNVAQSMEFYAKKHKIVVTSHMRSTTDVNIFNVSGMCIASFNIEPGETIETPVNNGGVYIIHAAGGHYTKKITMK